MTNEYSIAVLLPTRGRTDALSRSVISLFNRCTIKDKVQLILAFDNDDEVGMNHFTEHVQPWLDERNISYTAMCFDSMGYEGLNKYYNAMADEASADWLFVWNDDAIMETAGWDKIINLHTGKFQLLKVHTHGEHPYSIFPIVPSEWVKTTGYLSCHQMIDAELSQIAYMLDVMEIIDIYVTHDRADLTGNNKDDTDKKRVRLEGNPQNPQDFHHMRYNQYRILDCDKLTEVMKKHNLNTDWWENVKTGKQYPWEKLVKNDINKQMTQFQVRMNSQGRITEIAPDNNANIVRQETNV